MTERIPLTPKIVLAVGAHADDIDFGASGSVAKWAKEGAEVHYLIITDGSKGSADPGVTGEELIAIREREQQEAAATLGAKQVHFLRYEDAALEVTQALKKDIVRVIRQVRPDTVVVMDPTFVYSSETGFINHPDHRAAGQATLDAVFPLARDHLSFPDLYTREHLKPHKVAHVLLINLDRQNFFVDISGTFELKVAGLMKHASQVLPEDRLRPMLEQRAAVTGGRCGAKYAEGFVRIDCMP
ncbi:MAG TPA: PIG-L deacetylase family protein [Candidatus Saccharimonadales bacterium]